MGLARSKPTRDERRQHVIGQAVSRLEQQHHSNLLVSPQAYAAVDDYMQQLKVEQLKRSGMEFNKNDLVMVLARLTHVVDMRELMQLHMHTVSDLRAAIRIAVYDDASSIPPAPASAVAVSAVNSMILAPPPAYEAPHHQQPSL